MAPIGPTDRPRLPSHRRWPLRGIVIVFVAMVVAITVGILYITHTVGPLIQAIASVIILILLLVRYWETKKAAGDAELHDL